MLYITASDDTKAMGPMESIRKIAQGDFLFDSDLPAPEPEFTDSEFIVTPTVFSLDSGEEIMVHVEFTPTEVCDILCVLEI